jgi:hypothetical protein
VTETLEGEPRPDQTLLLQGLLEPMPDRRETIVGPGLTSGACEKRLGSMGRELVRDETKFIRYGHGQIGLRLSPFTPDISICYVRLLACQGVRRVDTCEHDHGGHLVAVDQATRHAVAEHFCQDVRTMLARRQPSFSDARSWMWDSSGVSTLTTGVSKIGSSRAAHWR